MRYQVIEDAVTFENIAPLGRIGLIALATDYNLETDLRRYMPDGVEIFTNRVLNANPVTLETLRAMAPDLTRAAGGILPGTGVDAVIYGCTSGTAAIGQENVADAVHTALPGVPVTNPLQAACSALDHLGLSRVTLLTPYFREVNETLVAGFAERGIAVETLGSFENGNDTAVAEIATDSIVAAACRIDDPSTEAMFISCTSFRTAQAIPILEERLGKPVLSSNQALAWHALQLIGYTAGLPGRGWLFQPVSS